MAISRSPRVGGRADKPRHDADEMAFRAWWLTYPRHEAKQPALAAYRKRRRAGRSVEALLDAALNYAEHVHTTGTPTDKIAHGATFLNQHRDEEWERGPPDPARRAAPTTAAPKLAQTAAELRLLKARQEMHGDERTSFWALATTGVGLPDAGGAPSDAGALPGPPQGPALA